MRVYCGELLVYKREEYEVENRRRGEVLERTKRKKTRWFNDGR